MGYQVVLTGAFNLDSVEEISSMIANLDWVEDACLSFDEESEPIYQLSGSVYTAKTASWQSEDFYAKISHDDLEEIELKEETSKLAIKTGLSSNTNGNTAKQAIKSQPHPLSETCQVDPACFSYWKMCSQSPSKGQKRIEALDQISKETAKGWRKGLDDKAYKSLQVVLADERKTAYRYFPGDCKTIDNTRFLFGKGNDLAKFHSYFMVNWGQGDSVDSKFKRALHYAVQNYQNLNLDLVDIPSQQTALSYYQEHQELFDSLVASQYEFTQKHLREKQIKTVQAYRIANVDKPINPLASFTMTRKSVRDFLKYNCEEGARQDLVSWAVPVEKIWSTPLTGAGEMYQDEILVLTRGNLDESSFQRIEISKQDLKNL